MTCQKKMETVTNNKTEPDKRGHLFIISAPSGAGKSTLCKAMLERFPDMLYSVSSTTRQPRRNEKNGVDYYFITKEEFEKNIQKRQWAEWAEVYGNYYGTSAEWIERKQFSGHDLLLDIDIQGTLQILKRFPDSITIFVMPPSLDVLRNRLTARGSESETAIGRRIEDAKKEMTQKDRYRHIIVNNKLVEAVEELASIMEKYRSINKMTS